MSFSTIGFITIKPTFGRTCLENVPGISSKPIQRTLEIMILFLGDHGLILVMEEIPTNGMNYLSTGAGFLPSTVVWPNPETCYSNPGHLLWQQRVSTLLLNRPTRGHCGIFFFSEKQLRGRAAKSVIEGNCRDSFGYLLVGQRQWIWQNLGKFWQTIQICGDLRGNLYSTV